MGLGRDHVERYLTKTGHRVFPHLRKIRHYLPQEKSEQEPEKKITRLAIGIEGGFQPDSVPKFEIQEKNSIVVFPGPVTVELPSNNLPLQVLCRSTTQSCGSLKKLFNGRKTIDLQILCGIANCFCSTSQHVFFPNNFFKRSCCLNRKVLFGGTS